MKKNVIRMERRDALEDSGEKKMNVDEKPREYVEQ